MTRRPEDALELVQREVEKLWRDLIYRRHPASHFADQPWTPLVDVVVSENSARVILELAGVPRENVRVRLRGNTLEVSGRRSPPQEQAGAFYHRAEIYFGDFSRAIELPWEADEKSVQALSRDGMLEIRLQAAAEPKHVEVPIKGQTA